MFYGHSEPLQKWQQCSKSCDGRSMAAAPGLEQKQSFQKGRATPLQLLVATTAGGFKPWGSPPPLLNISGWTLQGEPALEQTLGRTGREPASPRALTRTGSGGTNDCPRGGPTGAWAAPTRRTSQGEHICPRPRGGRCTRWGMSSCYPAVPMATAQRCLLLRVTGAADLALAERAQGSWQVM